MNEPSFSNPESKEGLNQTYPYDAIVVFGAANVLNQRGLEQVAEDLHLDAEGNPLLDQDGQAILPDEEEKDRAANVGIDAVSPLAKRRVQTAFQAWKLGLDPYIVTTGGPVWNGKMNEYCDSGIDPI